MEVSLVSEGLKFMVLGMVTVFLFLIVMVLILKLQAKIVQKFFPPKVVSTPRRSAPTQVSSKRDDKALVAAITAAITTFKNSQNSRG